MRKLIAFSLFIALFASCVPVKRVEELKTKYDKCEGEREYLAGEKDRLETENAELKAEVKKLKQAVRSMIDDTASTAKQYRQLRHETDRLKKINTQLREKADALESGSNAENRKLMSEVMALQDDLQIKEDKLKLLDKQLDDKEKRLNKLQEELEAREKRVQELEDIIAQKDAAVKALRDKVKDALTGFADKGITVEQRNGRVYVSMEAKLLFASGSTSVGSEGTKAVVQLAKALENQNELTILVEGHTDTDPISSSCIKDNWDLSVMRATSVVRIMMNNSSINPQTLTAAGRGEHFPIASNDTPEGKAKNRRIEVILTPNLDKLFKILDESAQQITNDEGTE